MSDRTTINVTKEAHQKAKEAKRDGESWSEYIQRCIGESQEPNPKPMQIEAEDMRPMIREEIANAMSEVTLDVTIDGDSDMNEEDVRNIVDAKLDAFKEELY